jgi:hypothetical protein
MEHIVISRYLTATLLVALASCGSSAGSASAPTECPEGEFLIAVQGYVDNAKFIDTPWEPAPGTDLEAAISAGGAACSYGIQEAEVGATILWANGADLFASRSAQWEADGYQRVEVDGVDEAWALIEETDVERHLWIVSLLADGVWIHINTTFLSDLEEARPLIDAAIDVTHTN